MKYVVLLMLYVNTTLQSANIVKVSNNELSSSWSCFVCCLYVGDLKCSTRRNWDLAKQPIFPWLLFCLRLPLRISRRVCLDYSSLPLLSLWVVYPFLDSQCLWNASCNIKFIWKCFGGQCKCFLQISFLDTVPMCNNLYYLLNRLFSV